MRVGAYSIRPTAPRTSYIQVLTSTSIEGVASNEGPSSREDSEYEPWVRKPYRPRQYVAAAPNTLPGLTRTSRTSTCSRAPVAELRDPTSTRSLQSDGTSTPAEPLMSRRGGRSMGSAHG